MSASGIILPTTGQILTAKFPMTEEPSSRNDETYPDQTSFAFLPLMKGGD